MVVSRQRVDTFFEVDGVSHCLVITRGFVLNLLCRRQISDAGLFSFIEENRGFLILLGRRKLFKLKRATTGVTLDQTDLPDYTTASP